MGRGRLLWSGPPHFAGARGAPCWLSLNYGINVGYITKNRPGYRHLEAATEKARKLEQKATFDKLTARIASLTEQLEQQQKYTANVKEQRDRWERTCKEMSEAKRDAAKQGRASNLAARFAMAARVERERSRQSWWGEGGASAKVMVDRLKEALLDRASEERVFRALLEVFGRYPTIVK